MSPCASSSTSDAGAAGGADAGRASTRPATMSSTVSAVAARSWMSAPCRSMKRLVDAPSGVGPDPGWPATTTTGAGCVAAAFQKRPRARRMRSTAVRPAAASGGDVGVGPQPLGAHGGDEPSVEVVDEQPPVAGQAPQRGVEVDALDELPVRGAARDVDRDPLRHLVVADRPRGEGADAPGGRDELLGPRRLPRAAPAEDEQPRHRPRPPHVPRATTASSAAATPTCRASRRVRSRSTSVGPGPSPSCGRRCTSPAP